MLVRQLLCTKLKKYLVLEILQKDYYCYFFGVKFLHPYSNYANYVYSGKFFVILLWVHLKLP